MADGYFRLSEALFLPVDEFIKVQATEKPLAHIVRHRGRLGAYVVQVNGLPQGVDDDPAIFAIGQVAIDLSAYLFFQVTIDIVRKGIQ